MNDTPGRSMRFCEECGVALGIMTKAEFVDKYIDGKCICPYCGKPVIKQKEDDVVV